LADPPPLLMPRLNVRFIVYTSLNNERCTTIFNFDQTQYRFQSTWYAAATAGNGGRGSEGRKGPVRDTAQSIYNPPKECNLGDLGRRRGRLGMVYSV
jgi:hypothetical protein